MAEAATTVLDTLRLARAKLSEPCGWQKGSYYGVLNGSSDTGRKYCYCASGAVWAALTPGDGIDNNAAILISPKLSAQSHSEVGFSAFEAMRCDIRSVDAGKLKRYFTQ